VEVEGGREGSFEGREGIESITSGVGWEVVERRVLVCACMDKGYVLICMCLLYAC
jgi:hypothetical protein